MPLTGGLPFNDKQTSDGRIIPGLRRQLEDDLKDYIIFSEQENPVLNIVIDLVNTRVATDQLYRPGGLFEQPYFLMCYVEPWVKQAYDELKAVRSGTVGQEHGLDAAIQAALQGAFE